MPWALVVIARREGGWLVLNCKNAWQSALFFWAAFPWMAPCIRVYARRNSQANLSKTPSALSGFNCNSVLGCHISFVDFAHLVVGEGVNRMHTINPKSFFDRNCKFDFMLVVIILITNRLEELSIPKNLIDWWQTIGNPVYYSREHTMPW